MAFLIDHSQPVIGLNFAVPGQTTVDMLTDVDSQVLPWYHSAYKSCVALVLEGTNDMHFNGASKQLAYSRLVQYCQRLKGKGIKTVVIGATPRNNPPSPYPPVPSTYDWQGLNALIRSSVGNGSSGIDAFADIGAISQLQNQNDRTYYVEDGTHFYTEAAYQLITPIVAQAILNLL